MSGDITGRSTGSESSVCCKGSIAIEVAAQSCGTKFGLAYGPCDGLIVRSKIAPDVSSPAGGNVPVACLISFMISLCGRELVRNLSVEMPSPYTLGGAAAVQQPSEAPLLGKVGTKEHAQIQFGRTFNHPFGEH